MAHAPPPSSTTAQYTGQFLTTILSQRGPSSLPYSEDTKYLIRQHLLSLSDSYPSLQPKTATFTHNDGRSVNLLQSNGTVPMVFQSVTYNIPVAIWLMETYPRHAPLVFVNPTRDMVVKRGHQFVNPSGLVSIPYLQNWVYPSSNLVDLVRNLSHYFGIEPPLFSQRNGSHVRPAIPPGPVTEDAGEVFRRNAVNKLVENVCNDVNELRKKREVEMEGMFSAQAVLRLREDELKKGVREMLYEKEALEQQLQMVLMNTDVLDGWVKENEGKLSESANVGSFNVNDAFETVDLLSKQMLESTASDLAIEDVIYALDKAVQEGSVPVDLYLRNVRLFSREQFFHRATSAKVRAVQMQAHVTSMASRAPPYAV